VAAVQLLVQPWRSLPVGWPSIPEPGFGREAGHYLKVPASEGDFLEVASQNRLGVAAKPPWPSPDLIRGSDPAMTCEGPVPHINI
jgi:hypothetical protein